MLEAIDPNYAADIDHNDEIRIIRALEIYKNSGKKLSEIFSNNPTNGIKEKYEVIQFGIKTDRDILHERIKARLYQMIDNGLVEETENILKDFKIAEDHMGNAECMTFVDQMPLKISPAAVCVYQ